MRGVAAITLDRSGGGVAAVSRLLWRVVREAWPHGSRLLALTTGPVSTSTAASRLRFGARLARAQAVGGVRWILFSHLAVAQAQTYVPRFVRRPYAIFLHGIEVWREMAPRQRQVLEGASLLIANSVYTRRRVVEMHPWIGRVAECPLCIPDEAAHLRPYAPHDSTESSQTVMVVGRMDSRERYKGHDQLLEAWPRVRRGAPDARLLVVGSGDDLPRLRAKAAVLGVDRSVTFTGFVPEQELRRLYAAAAVFAMPSRNEGFGLVYLEAMEHGLPCIGSTHDAASDIIRDGVTGYLVEQPNLDRLAERIIGLLGNAELRRRMGAAGRALVRREFGYEGFRSRLLALMGDAFEPRGARAALARQETRVS